MDSSDVLETADNVVRSGGKEALQFWRQVLPEAVEDPEFLNESAGEVVQLVFQTLPVYSDPKLQKAVLSFLRSACAQNETFVKALAASIVKRGPQKVSRQQSLTLLQWSTIVIRHLDITKASKAVQKLIDCQVAYLESILRSGFKWVPVRMVLFPLWREKAGSVDVYLDSMKSSGSPALAKTVLWFASSRPELMARVRPIIQPLFLDKVLGSKELLDKEQVQAYLGLAKQMTSQELEESVLPHIFRLAKRSPEPVLHNSILFLEMTEADDLSSSASKAITEVTTLLRHSRDTVRKGAADFLAVFAKRVKDPVELHTMYTTLQKILDGTSSGKIRNATERHGLLMGISSVLASYSAETSTAGDEAVEFLATYVRDENNEDASLETINALGLALSSCSKASNAVLKQLATGLQEKELLRRALLRSLIKALESNAAFRKAAQCLGSPLLKVVNDGLQKEPMRIDALLALQSLSLLAIGHQDLEEKLNAESAWQGLFSQDPSPLLCIDVVVKMSEQDTCMIAKFCQHLLTHFGRASRDQRLQHSKISDVLMSLALHHSSLVRNTVLNSFSTAFIQTLTGLLHSLQQLLRGDLPQTLITKPKSEDPVQPSEVAGRMHTAVVRIFETILKRSQSAQKSAQTQDGSERNSEKSLGRHVDVIPAEVIAMTLQIVCHPFVAAFLRTHRNPWALFQRGMGKSFITAENISPICDSLFGEFGLGSSYQAEVDASYAAVRSLIQDNVNVVANELLPRIEQALDRREAEALSPSEITILQTPEGQLAISVDVTSIGGAGLMTHHLPTMNGQLGSKKGQSSLANGSAKLSKELPKAASKGTAVKKDTAEERRRKQLEEESQVRKRVKGVQIRLERGLKAFTAACNGDQDWTLSNIEKLQSLIQPLLQSPLVGEGPAFDAQVAIASSLPGKLGRHALSVATALQVVELHQSGSVSGKELAEHSAVLKTVEAMTSVTAGRSQLPPPAFRLCYPILAAILSLPEISPLHEPAMAILALHVAPSLDVPRGKMLALMYHVLGVIPAYRGKVQNMVADLCRGVQEKEIKDAFQGLLAVDPHVRAVALSSIPHIPLLAADGELNDVDLTTILWLSQYDPDVANSESALELWESTGCSLQPGFLPSLLTHLGSPYPDIRQAAAEGLAFGLEEVSEGKEQALAKLLEMYHQSRSSAPQAGVALALQSCAFSFSQQDVSLALNFLLEEGVKNDHPEVRSSMVDAGVAIVDAHGKEEARNMMPLFEEYLAKPTPEDEHLGDRMRQGAVVFLGTTASHMEPGNPKVKDIVERLVKTLKTPSLEVQTSVAACLPAIMALLKSDRSYTEDLVARLLDQLLKGKTFVDRNGAALGLAGVVKGLKIVAVNGHGILDKLKIALQDKDAEARQGSLLAFEALVAALGRLFEPYIVECMAELLDKFGDGSDHVREANSKLAQTIMANLSNAGVKLTLPTLLDGVDAKSWRGKQGSVQMLGAMAHLAPQPLSTALPKVVPKLSQALSDPHAKVQAAAKRALKEVGSVIRNPEVQKLVPALMSAIAEPDKHGKKALDQLLGTTFVNTVDAASLALIVPVVHKSLRDRSGDSKKRAARIVGSMCTLMNDPKDMAPYIPLLLPGLQQALVDPLPDVRATAAKAVGVLLGGMGAEHCEELMPWLLNTLKSEGSSVERSGAAQGLAEVLAVLGREYIDGLMPDILQSCKSKNPNVREGHLTLFKFLPAALGDSFQDYLQTVLPAILTGLADESEGVRNAALAAGRTFVEFYAQTSLPLLLPTVEAGIVNDNWRIRQSSIDLLGDLLFKVAGTSGKVRLDESEAEGLSTEAHGAAIIEALGLDRRNQILSKVYLARSDVGLSVRNAAVHVWKTLVTNTPRTLKEILSCLMENVIALLAGDGEEQQQMAGSCLGELVRKMGDQVLRQIIPILQEGVKDPSPATRVGVCTGLTHLLENIGNLQLKEHLSHLLPTVQRALVDPDPDVQQAAGQAFAILFRGGGHSAVDSIVPSMLMSLTNDTKQAAQALEGLRVILSVRPQTLGVMLPKLMKPQCTPTSMKALASLAEVAGSSIHNHLNSLIPSLLRAASSETTAEYQAADLALRKICNAVGEEGVYLLLGQLEKALEDPIRRQSSAKCIGYFCETTKHDFQEHVPSLLTNLLSLMSEEGEGLLTSLWTATGAVTASVPKEMLAFQLQTVREALSTAKERQRRKRLPGDVLLPGCCLPKPLGPILPIYLQAVLQGTSAELRENAAVGIGELVEVTSEEALKPFVVQMTGPLIRIIGDRFPWEVKAAILKTLGLLIKKAGMGLKPFVPQLQTTFLKCLPDPASLVRQTAAQNLGRLSGMSVRIDALASELLSQTKNASGELKEPYLVALKGVLASSGSRLSSATLTTAGETLQDLLQQAGGSEGTLRAVAACLGEFSAFCNAAELEKVLQKGVWQHQTDLSAALLLASIARTAPQRLEEAQCIDKAVQRAVEVARAESSGTREAACYAVGNLALAEVKRKLPSGSALGKLVSTMVALLSSDQISDVQRIQLHVLRCLAFQDREALQPHFVELVPSLCGLLSGGTGPTKLATERTLSRVLQAADGPELTQSFLATPGPGMSAARSTLSEIYLRRLSKLPLDDVEDNDFNLD